MADTTFELTEGEQQLLECYESSSGSSTDHRDELPPFAERNAVKALAALWQVANGAGTQPGHIYDTRRLRATAGRRGLAERDLGEVAHRRLGERLVDRVEGRTASARAEAPGASDSGSSGSANGKPRNVCSMRVRSVKRLARVQRSAAAASTYVPYSPTNAR